MLTAIVLGSMLVSSSPESSGAAAGDLAAYRSAAARAGTDPDANVRLALWCESRGMAAERARHLAAAQAADPANARARGLAGLVADRGCWRTASELADATQSDEALNAALAEYNARREAIPTPDTADAHWAMALWCEAKGLLPEAIAHFTVVTRLAPGRADARQKLGLRPYRGKWLSEERIRFEEAEDLARRDADGRWRETLHRWWREYVNRDDPDDRSGLVRLLAPTLEPRAVPTIVSVFGKGEAGEQLVEVRLLDRIDAPDASRELARLAVVGRDDEIRGEAVGAITRRDHTEAVDWLVGSLHDPLRIEVEQERGAVGVLEVEDEHSILRKVYRERVIRGRPGRGGAGAPGWLLGAILPPAPRVGGTTARQKLARDFAAAEAFNARRESVNERVGLVLASVTGKPLGSDPEAWHKWWSEERGVSYYRTSSYAKPVTRRVSVTTVAAHSACFARGTPVRTVLGARPIESLQVGDRVLTADVTTGALEVRPVVAVRHTPPSKTLRLSFGSELIVATPIHRFWKAGAGWVMARDLKPGDAVRSIGGVLRLVSTAPDSIQPVFNLEVADGRSYFVGDRGALVHDYSAPAPVSSPFDAAPRTADLATLAANARPAPARRGSMLGPVAPR